VNLELLESPDINAFLEHIHSHPSLLIENVNDAVKALLISLANQKYKNILCISGTNKEESHVFHNLAFFSEAQVIDFPAWETLPSEKIPPSPDVVGDRFKILTDLRKSKDSTIVLTNLQASLQKVLDPETLASYTLTIQKGEELLFSSLKEHLLAVGYQQRPLVVDKGEFAIRGGIIDIFPVSSPEPIRLEFWDDEIESIRKFDPISQTSRGTLETIFVPPAHEKELISQEDSLSTLLDYFDTPPLIIFDDFPALEDRYISFKEIPGTFSKSFMTIDELFEKSTSLKTIFFSPKDIHELSSIKKEQNYLRFETMNQSISSYQWQHPFFPVSHLLSPLPSGSFIHGGDEFLLSIHDLSQQDKTLHFIYSHPSERDYIEKKLHDLDVSLPPEAQFNEGYLSSSIAAKGCKHVLVPYAEITKRYKIRRQKQRSNYHTTPLDFSELTPGDVVVHLEHGMGKFLGIEKRKNHLGEPTEFLLLQYAEGAKLYVPFTQSHLVSKYIGANELSPTLHTLGSGRWKRSKENTEKALVDYASQLLESHAQRELIGGFSYPDSSSDFRAFEEEFPFVETEDQMQAIQSIKEDMQASTPMDRLICGDVGYGKTEVAMRAACKAALDGGKQVAVLVPTTVLAIQHYETFCQRMKEYPVVIKCLSRFQKPKEIKETLEALSQGRVDIVVGTHRLTSKDVHFHDLGLLIIDEEQRFGVKVKEHIRQLKSGIDTISMSATPIPRTLYLSLTGARDMSVINTPPQDRLPIQTNICEINDHIIKDALLRELSRDGQAYVIHNRVESIYRFADRIQKIMPKARLVVAHGQLTPDEIDKAFHAFKQGEADILVATSIVENGIDVPNANTILIDRADHFGLAELYQLRGRVGRWNRRAFAYFLIPTNRVLAEIAEKRLRALEEANGFGGGMRIAMRDLEIRGAGNILGTEQSGHIATIGFHLYCKLLKRTIEQLQGSKNRIFCDTKMEFPIDARLPEDYVNDTTLRMTLYQRFGEAQTFDILKELLEEVKDRFGTPPKSTQWLYCLMRIRIHAQNKYISHLKIKGSTLYVRRQRGKELEETSFPVPMVDNPDEFETFIVAGLDHHIQ
jgi:transcription-repair coupling factor (superfamily II helicase)